MHKDIFYYSFNNKQVKFRLYSETDSIAELTEMLNRAYKFLADMGLNYTAATQDQSITLDRVKKAYKCYVGIYNNRIISTIALRQPKPSSGCNWYNQKFVAKFGQFAVLPEFQKYGVGSKMMDIVEEQARDIQNVRELALDTAESAYHLINYYKKRGYRYKETVSWRGKSYNSVILSKLLY